MTGAVHCPRLAAARLSEALSDTPVVLVHGPRQCGKTTLARSHGVRTGRACFTFDDAATLAAAEADPVGFVDELPPWHSNRLSRLVKSAKVHLGDSGLACALLGLDAEALAADRTALGQLLETFVVQELRRLTSGLPDGVEFHHYRDRDGAEVDLVLERGPRELAGVEVKAGATVTASDFRGLRTLREAVGSRFKAGVVLYDGEATLPFGDRLHAVPLRCLWDA